MYNKDNIIGVVFSSYGSWYKIVEIDDESVNLHKVDKNDVNIVLDSDYKRLFTVRSVIDNLNEGEWHVVVGNLTSEIAIFN